jgi:antitoxin (DNA-binding transcriptional repressor) of toxin-antitoxin stability system
MKSSTAISITEAQERLKDLIEELPLGETVTVVNPEGTPLALLVSLNSTPPKPMSAEEWQRRWDILAQKIGESWQGEKSAVEVLAEMRR